MHTTRTVPLALAALALGSCLASPDAGNTSAENTTPPSPVSTRPPPTASPPVSTTTLPAVEPSFPAPTGAEPTITTTRTAPAIGEPTTTTGAEPVTTTTTIEPTTTTAATSTTSTTTDTITADTSTIDPADTDTPSSTTTTVDAPADTDAATDSEPSVHQVSVSTVEFMPRLLADIHAPAQPGNYPVVVLAFGGGWTLGSRTQLSTLADYLASRGIVAVNGDHRTLLHNRRVPDMVGEVSCLAAAAPHLAAPHLTQPAGPVWLLGFSSGAHLAALAALTDHSPSPECPHAAGEVAGMIGLGGPYDLDELWKGGIPDGFLDIEALGARLPAVAVLLRRLDTEAMQLFLRLVTGVTPEDTEEWKALNPMALAGRRPERPFLLVTGGADEMTYPLHSARFAEALRSGGHQVSIEIIPHFDHLSLTDPDQVGETIRSFVKK